MLRDMYEVVCDMAAEVADLSKGALGVAGEALGEFTRIARRDFSIFRKRISHGSGKSEANAMEILDSFSFDDYSGMSGDEGPFCGYLEAAREGEGFCVTIGCDKIVTNPSKSESVKFRYRSSPGGASTLSVVEGGRERMLVKAASGRYETLSRPDFCDSLLLTDLAEQARYLKDNSNVISFSALARALPERAAKKDGTEREAYGI